MTIRIAKPNNKLKIKHRKVLDAYFAKRIDKAEYENADSTYVVKSGDTLGGIAKKHSLKVSDLKDANSLTSDLITVGQELTIQKAKKKGSKVSFKKIESANLGDEVYVIVTTDQLQGKEIGLNVLQGQDKGLVGKDSPIKLQVGNQETIYPTATVGAYSHDKEITNKEDFIDWAIFKIVLGPKDSSAYAETLSKLDQKKTSLFLLIDAHSKDKLKVIYNGRNPAKNGKPDPRSTPNYWLDLDNKWFELKKGCDCGSKEFDKKFACTRYGSVYGPVYWGSQKLADYKFWDELVKTKKVTEEEKDILIGMSENEGKLDSIQSYDSEILTVGAMQKTINPQGKGEFPIQVQEFKKDYPAKYKELFEECGWSVQSGTMYYKDPSDSDATKITGSALKKKIREGYKKSEFKKKLKCKPLEPIAKAASDKDFQAKQVKDFIDRLKNKVLPIKPKGYTHPLSAYLKSKLGKATVLDHHINRPAYVKTDFAEALDNFFTKKDKEVDDFNKLEKDKSKHKKKVSKDPSTWGDNHADYEKDILDDYGVNRRGTDMKTRYDKMKSKF